jgi:uncharacterized coiled-coil protein SlyX
MSEKPMFEDCTTGLTCSAIEAEMRDRLAAKDARIAELSSAVAGKVQLIEPDPETIAWAEGVFAAEDDKNATIEDLSRKLEASRHRVAELEQQIYEMVPRAKSSAANNYAGTFNVEGKQDATGQALVDLLQGSPLQDVKIERDSE